MPNIPQRPISPVKATLPQVVNKPAAKVSNTTYEGIRTARGGLRVPHTSEVIDNSGDRNQYLPYVASCRTCGWQARVREKDEAVNLAQGHVNFGN